MGQMMDNIATVQGNVLSVPDNADIIVFPILFSIISGDTSIV